MGHTGKIVCYFTDNTDFTIPSDFYTHTSPKFANEKQALKWIEECSANGEFPSFSFASKECQLRIIDEDVPRDVQLKQAMLMREVVLVSKEENEQISQKVYALLAAIAPNHRLSNLNGNQSQ